MILLTRQARRKVRPRPTRPAHRRASTILVDLLVHRLLRLQHLFLQRGQLYFFVFNKHTSLDVLRPHGRLAIDLQADEQVFGPTANMSKNQFSRPLTKPIGFSQFPREITKPPRHWVEKVHNLVFYNAHEVSLRGRGRAVKRAELTVVERRALGGTRGA